MQPNQLFEGQLIIKAHAHPTTRRVFAYPEAVYANWLLLIPETGSFQYWLSHELGQGIAAYGDVILLPPGTLFRRNMLQPVQFHMIEFDWTTLEGLSVDLAMAAPVGKIHIKQTQMLESLVSLLTETYLLHDPDNPYWKTQLLRNILQLIYLERHIASQTANAGTSLFIQKAQQLLTTHAFEMDNLSHIAELLGLSQAHFSVKYKAKTGQSPSQWVTGLRMNKAKALLLETELTLEDIARQCGYQSGFYLSRMFTRYYGLSPSVFRKEHRV
jgi:AraC-type DNA-binding domain-containing proteins